MLCLGSLWKVLARQRASQLLFHFLLVSLTTKHKQCSKPVMGIRDILVRIQIRTSD
jgi:hypothetical protein